MGSYTDKFLKIKGQKEVKEYGLPMSETIFIFDFKKQEKEIDKFLKNRKYVSIRSDSQDGPDFCPHDLKCPKKKAKSFIKELNFKGYAVMVQEYVPWEGDKASGNILILKNNIIVELMGEGPLIWLTRDGKVEECILFERNNLKELWHFGKRLIEKRKLSEILKMVKKVPLYRIIEFTLRPEGLYFWQIRKDTSAAEIEKEIMA